MAVTLSARLPDLQLEAIVAVIRHGRDIRAHQCGFKRKSRLSAVLISPANNDEQTYGNLTAWVRYGACYYPCADNHLHECAAAIPSPLSCCEFPSWPTHHHLHAPLTIGHANPPGSKHTAASSQKARDLAQIDRPFFALVMRNLRARSCNHLTRGEAIQAALIALGTRRSRQWKT